jgi:hypothetical protein
MDQVIQHPWVIDTNVATQDEVMKLFNDRGLVLLEVPEAYM